MASDADLLSSQVTDSNRWKDVEDESQQSSESAMAVICKNNRIALS